MKWLVMALLLLNIAAAMWGLWFKAPAYPFKPVPPEIAADQLRLLSEPGVEPKKNPPPKPPAKPEKAEAKTPIVQKVCFELGPFSKTAAVAEAMSSVKQTAVEFSQRSVIKQTIAGYRVYLPTRKSVQRAETLRRQLSKLGFRDHYVIKDGPLKTNVSLGFYLVRENAEQRVREAKKHKMKAKIDTVAQEKTLYWLDLQAPKPEQAKIKGMKWGNGVQLKPQACPKAKVQAK